MKKELSQRLINFGIEPAEARCEADLMLAAASGLTQSQIFLHSEQVLPPAIQAKLESYMLRRQSHEPLQHILGEAYFMGFPFKVNGAVLIPRPETETLVEAALVIIKERFGGVCSLLDIGAGSGAIVLSLLKLFSGLTATAYEISEEAAVICRQNAEHLGVGDRLRLVCADFLLEGPTMAALGDEKFQLIVSNPPYIRPGDIASLQVEVKDFEPRLALVGLDPDGLGFYRAFAGILPALSATGGSVLLAEFGQGQGDRIKDIFRECGWQKVELLPDLSGTDRVIKASWPD